MPKKNSEPSLFNQSPPHKPKSSVVTAKDVMQEIDFAQQVNHDQKRYSRYVCDSRAIPNLIDGLKPVQRRILWTMWSSDARSRFTKTVKVSGMTMAYHPHGNASIEDAIAGMVQRFPFANNYPLLQGEGTFGDVLDPKAIASPRYTEVRLSPFVHDAGFFESLEDIDYTRNYDDTQDEPVFFVPKLPTLLLNPTIGIATGFRCSFPARSITSVADAFLSVLAETPKTELEEKGIPPWFQGYDAEIEIQHGENGQRHYLTHFGFTRENKKVFLTSAPQGWNREKTIAYLEALCKNSESILRDYFDYSMSTFRIELFFNRGVNPLKSSLKKIFNKSTRESIEQNVISSSGVLGKKSDLQIIEEFIKTRVAHLRTRFKRLAEIEKQRIQRESELIRFIKEGWNKQVTKISSKTVLEKKLNDADFRFTQWLSALPIYRLTSKEVEKSEKQIATSKKEFAHYRKLHREGTSLRDFMRSEVLALVEKYSGKNGFSN